jgi:predicted RNA-binding Zn ribbon-like protein
VTEEAFTFDFCGGHLAVDFSNTVSDRHTDHPIERLTSYERLVAFAAQAQLLSPAEADKLRARAKKNPREAVRILDEARVFRDALYGLVSHAATVGPIRAIDLEVLNARSKRLYIDETLGWSYKEDESGLDAIMGPIIRASVDLLTTDLRKRIRMCEAHDCVWVFLDTSKNRTRRWCTMKSCGNRAKARRFQARHA